MGLFQNTANFLGIDKFGQGLASTTRAITGEVGQDIENQQRVDAGNQKVLYALRNETDPVKKKHLQEFLQRQNFGNADTSAYDQQSFVGTEPTATQIDPGLNLSNKEILGSAANVALNIGLGGSLSKAGKLGGLVSKAAPLLEGGGKLGTLGRGAALGSAFGFAQGLEKDRSNVGVLGSTIGGAITGGAISAVGLVAKAAKDFLGNKVPEWMMNKAVKPALQDLKKNVKFGTNTLGKELLDEGVKGGPRKLLQIADDKTVALENELQSVLSSPSVSEAQITRNSIKPYLKDLITQKNKIPGGKGDIQRIETIFNDLPESMSLPQANEIKRAIYQELRDPAYKLDAKLNAKAGSLKQIAKGLKTEIENAVGGNVVKDINHKLSIYGRLENSMIDQLAREMRNNGIGLTDAILASGGPTTTLIALLRHLGQGLETNTAQGLHKIAKVGTGITARAAKNLAKRAILNAP